MSALCLGLGCAPAPEGAARRAIVGGAPSADDAVVALVRLDPVCFGGPPTQLCTGLVVHESAVLTAAHCVEGLAPLELAVLGGPSTDAPVWGRAVIAVEAHPGYDAATHEADLAVLWLDRPVSAAPAMLSPLPSDALGREARTVGFGEAAGGAGSEGVRREGTVTIDRTEETRFEASPGPALPCRGDSGGPAMMDIGGVERVVGVHVSGDGACETRADFVRIDAHLAGFVEPELSRAAERLAVAAEREAPGAGTDLCGGACAEDADCPLGGRCAETVAGRACVLGGADRPGALGDACSSSRDCETGGCMPALGDEPPGCRCYLPCEGPGADAGIAPRDGDGGCAVTRAGPAAWVLLMAWVALGLRPRRRATPNAR